MDKPYLEVVQKVLGKVRMSAPGKDVHRVGYFVEGLVASPLDLTASGLPLEACGSIEGMRPSDGIRREPTDRTVFGVFDFFEGMLDLSEREADQDR